MEVMNLSDFWQNAYAIKLVHSVVLVFFIFVYVRVATSLSQKKRGQRVSEAQYGIRFTAIFFFSAMLALIWLDGLGSLATVFTVVAAALTIVSKELILNFFGSFVIFWRELFAIGDRIQVGEHAGDVLDKGIMYFTLLESGRPESTGHSTGRLIKIPNMMALTMPVINSTRGAGYVWNEIRFVVTKTSNWQKGREKLSDIVHEYFHHESFDVQKVKGSFQRRNAYYDKLTPKVYVSVEERGICFTARYLCRSRMIRESEDFVTVRFLKMLEPGVLELA